MSTGKLLGAFACGLVVGLAIASIPFLATRHGAPAERAEADLLDPDALQRARVRESFEYDPPHIELQHGSPIEPGDAWTIGTPRDFSHEPHFEAIPVETRSGLVAFKAWESNGFTGEIATLCFGPGRNDIRVRVGSFSDMGPAGGVPWSYVSGRVQLSTWPPNQPGALIAFELEGQIQDRALMFAGKFQVPASGAHADSKRAGEPRIRVIANTSMDGHPSPSATRAPGSESSIERIPARPEVQAFRYMEFEPFGGVQATFSFGPGPDEVQVRVDDLSDAGPPDAWSALHGTIWLSPTPLDRAGSVVELELFGVRLGRPRRLAAKFLTPP